jgi:Bifunctional DNA primase/polymerase, N-terminal
VNEPLGATPADWYTWDFELGLTKHLLPCVPASPDVKCIEGSALEGKIGKIPSQFNGSGLAHGIADWQKRDIDPAEVALWARDPRLNLCVRTGKISHVYAIDVDIEDELKAQHVRDALFTSGDRWGDGFDVAPLRTRPNSSKFLIVFRMEEGCKKRIITVIPGNKSLGLKPQRIELLASGQQFVAAGTHASGVRYEWRGGLPSSLPSLTLSTLNNMWSLLEKTFAIEKPTTTSSTSNTFQNPQTTAGEILSEISEDDWQALIQALRFMLDKVEDNDVWSQIGYGLLSIRRSRPAQQLWLDFSSKAAGYEEGAPETWWAAHEGQTPRSDYRHIFTLARERGWSHISAPDAFPVVETELDVVPPELPDRPFVRVSDSGLVENIRQITELARPIVYTQGSQLARLGRANADEEIRRATDQVILVPVTAGWSRVHFTDIAQFQRFNGKTGQWVSCSCPADLVTVWLGQTDWPILRPLDAIARAPFVRADGSICDTAGYDSRGRALFIPSCSFPDIPVSPTRSDAEAALARLLSPFDEFPWYTNASRSAFAAHILTEACRLALDRVPMFWYTAPDAGTGKTILSESAATIVHGSEPAVRPWVSDGDELRKTLFASLLAGDRSIAFDNVPTGHKARSAELCAFLTSSIWKDRKLGVSETHAVPNKAVVSASGNNVTPVSDLARRCLVVRLDANSETMRERRFKIPNLRGYLLEHRPSLLVDALTIVKAYSMSEHEPTKLVALPSFESWSALVRDPLVWLGMPDPCDTQSHETDDESGSLGDVFERLFASFQQHAFTCADVSRLVGGMLDTDGELSALLLNNGCQEPSSPLKVGYWLRTMRDKNAGGYKLVHAGVSKTGARWKLTQQNPNGDLC